MIASAWIIGLSIFQGLLLARNLRGIVIEGPNTDAGKQVTAAAQAGRWRWPSDMHRYALGKARMKDASVLLLVFMQRLMRDDRSVYPVVLVCVFAHTVSAVLLFFIAQAYWSFPVAALLVLLYLTCLWPYQIILQGGYHIVAQMFFLLAVFCMQPGAGLASYLVAGGACGAMLFSSASSRKFLPLVLGAFVLSQRFHLTFPGRTFSEWILLLKEIGPFLVGFITATASLILGAHRFYPRIVTAAYERRAPGWMNALLQGREKRPLEYYLKKRGSTVGYLLRLGLFLVLAGTVCLVFFRSLSFYLSLAVFGLGGSAAVLFFTAPGIAENVKGYFFYSNLHKTSHHFRSYQDYFARRGIRLSPHMRGGGIPWLLRFFLRMVPFHTACALLAAGWLLPSYRPFPEPWGSAACLAVILLGFSPILVGESTRCFQLGRAYFPSLVGFLLLMGQALSGVTDSLSAGTEAVFWLCAAGMLLWSASWNLSMLATDVWPSRMAATSLKRTLSNVGVDRFATYDTPFNHPFVDALLLEEPGRYEVQRIHSLAEVSEGYLVVPGTSAKALNMVTEAVAVAKGDFTSDPILNGLLDSKEITRYAVASFKTLGSSRFWVQDDEVTTYRDLILREVGEEDRWRGRAWILDAEKLQADLRRGRPADAAAPPAQIAS